MPDLPTLRDLQRRLREATGPDSGFVSSLDADIFECLGGDEYAAALLKATMPCGDAEREYARGHAPRYTRSLDAAVALIERVLPDCSYAVGKGRERPDEPPYGAMIYSGTSSITAETGSGEHSANLALAACLALVSALIAIEEEKERAT